MSDTPRKQVGKTFEPPPWEREQFEELAKLREEPAQEVAGQAADTPAPEQPKAPDAQEPSVEKKEKIDEAEMTTMFAQLRAEEPIKDPSLWKIGLAFSGVSAVIGSVLVVWGLAAMLTTGDAAAGMIGGAILLAFGGLFVGVGVWMAVRSLKERGVL